jgi:hypothetical protein
MMAAIEIHKMIPELLSTAMKYYHSAPKSDRSK